MAKTYKNFFGKILYIIIIFIYFFLVTILSPFFIIIIFFIPELRRDILKRFFINKFKVKKEILVHASSAGEAILAYNLFKDNANYTYFNEGAYQIFKQKNINSLPLPFESIYTVFLFIFINRY